MTKEIIINADDFGLNASVNKAIIESFKNEFINSTTIMANMPGFEEAVELAHKNNILTKTGIHLILTEGLPLTAGIRKTNLFHNDNDPDLKRHKKSLFFLTGDEKKLIRKEFAAQIEKVQNTGIQISHIDTHHHIDEVWPVTQIILELLKIYNIPSMRILNNLNRNTRIYKSVYRRVLNGILKIKHANFTDYLGNQSEAVSRLRIDKSFCEKNMIEIMVHPDYNNEGILIDRINNQEIVFDKTQDLYKILTAQK